MVKLNRFKGLWDDKQLREQNENLENLEKEVTSISTVKQDAEKTLNEAIRVNNENISTQKQVDDLIIHAGKSDAEVIQARDGAPLLKDRLNNQDKDIVNSSVLSFQHESLVDKVKDLIQVRGMYIKKDDIGIYVGIGMGGGEKAVVEYRFMYNDDGLLLLRGVRSGVEGSVENKVDITLNGLFNENSAPSTFTTGVGDSFDFEFEGNSLYFTSVMESRGGIWEFELSNGMKSIVSCYSEHQKIERRLVFGDLEFQKYKGKAVFKGADPFNPPSSSARGYIYHTTGDPNTVALSIGKITPLNPSSGKWIVATNSIIDFAINATDSTASAAGVWVPQHGAVTGVSTNVSGRLFIDGEPIIQIVGIEKNTIDFKYREIDSVKISQTFRAKNPNANLVMWDHVITHTISVNNPILTILNSLSMVNNVFSAAGYLGMLASPPDNMNKLELNNGKIYSPIPKDNTEETFGLDVSSAIYVGENTPGRYHAVAMDVTSLKDAINLNAENINSPPGLITFRSDNVSKVYFLFSKNKVLESGKRFNLTHRVACISGERYPTTL